MLLHEEVVEFRYFVPHVETWQTLRMVYYAEDHVGGALVAFCDNSARVRDWGGAPNGMGRGMYERSRFLCALRSSFAEV